MRNHFSIVKGDFCIQARCFTDKTFRCCMNISVQNEPELQTNEVFFLLLFFSEPFRYAITANNILTFRHSYFIWIKQNALFSPEKKKISLKSGLKCTEICVSICNKDYQMYSLSDGKNMAQQIQDKLMISTE